MKPATPETELSPSTQLRKTVFGDSHLTIGRRLSILTVAGCFVLVFGGIAGAAESPLRPASAPPVKWALVPELSDEFNGNALDSAKWHPNDPKWKGRPPAPFCPENVSVKDGALQITIRKEEPVGYPKQFHTYTTGAVKSITPVLHGFFEVRCKAAKSAAASGFWFYDRTPPSGTEIDVFEINEPTRTIYQSWHKFIQPSLDPGTPLVRFPDPVNGVERRFLIDPDGKGAKLLNSSGGVERSFANDTNNNRVSFDLGNGVVGNFDIDPVTKRVKGRVDTSNTGSWVSPASLSDDYHVYGLEWNADELIFYVDGIERRARVKNTQWRHALHLVLDLETQPTWFGLPKPEELPATFIIDYVRAWKPVAR